MAGGSKRPSSKAAGLLARGAYTGVREHDKRPRTPLAGFFNLLLLFVCILLDPTTASQAQLTGELAELERLEQVAEESMAAGDPDGAALNIGRAALMASILSKEHHDKQDWYRGVELLFRAQENTYRALALFQRAGEHIPASSGVCRSLALGLEDATRSYELLHENSPLPTDQEESLTSRSKEWVQTIQELQEEVECTL